MTRRVRAAVGVAVLGLSCASASLARQDQPAAAPGPAPYERVVEENDGRVVSLQMAVREMAPPEPGKPRVFLAAAVHIGEPSFYKALQGFLDQQDVVLFEGVKPPGAGAAEHDSAAPQTDDQKAAATKRRVRFIAMAVERYRSEHDGVLPKDLDELQSGSEGRVASLLKSPLNDSWGHALVYTLAEPEPAQGQANETPRFDVVSLGADGKPGGNGAAADIKYSDQKPLSKPEKGDRSEGIQQKLADALGLVFQLSAMDNNKPNWRNSDLSIDQVQARLERAGVNADSLFRMLDGSSMFGKVAGLVLGMMSSTPESRAMLRVMLIETVANADVALAAAPGNMGKMMDVLLEDRNAVVIDDLKHVIATEPSVKSVAIIYGGGHLPTMQKRIESELGYTAAGDTWRTVMSVDAEKVGMSAEQLRRMREMIDKSFQQQAKAAARKHAIGKGSQPEATPSEGK